MFGLQSLLSKQGRDVVVDEAAEALEAQKQAARMGVPVSALPTATGLGGSKNIAPANRRFSILGSDLASVDPKSAHAHFKKTVLSLPADQNIQAMESGHTAVVFSNEGGTTAGALTKHTQHVWFQTFRDAAKEGFGALAWSDSIKDRTLRPEKSLALRNLTDVFVGKQYQPVFTQPITASADESRCLSLVAGTQQVSFEFESVQTLTLYIAGISHVLNSNGLVVQLESDEPSAAAAAAPAASVAAASSSEAPSSVKKGAGRRYSVAQINTMADLPSHQHHPHELAHQMAARRPTLMALSAASTLLLMEEGREFARYVSRGGEVVKESALVFFQPGTGSAPTEQDALFWARPGQRVPQADQRIRIAEITDIYLVRSNAHNKPHNYSTLCLLRQ
jgi:hypothetical protein